ncbi:kinase-like domain-containing protein [Gigaspora rosea]|uniref:Kinase-like domain-containing protein n=1 Tax=Gigaspora rosea TaxID=44941 RepID=A0A397VFV3_9GLOM|nr:kinase-like domain-containing protein [Gigaspora rosea]
MAVTTWSYDNTTNQNLKYLQFKFKKEFHDWTSGNHDIDQLIQQTQLNVMKAQDIIEWIPFNKFANLKYLAKGGFGTVFKALWIDGYIIGLNGMKNEWKRRSQMDVCLKSLDNSKNVKRAFIEEIENQHKHGGNSAMKIYGITKNPKDGNYMIVMEYAKKGSHRKLLDSKYNELDWASKIANLYYIADGLNTIHEAKLVHKDFHSGNIVNQNTFSPYITDFGLCKPVSQDPNSRELFGVLPYIAPEVLYTSGKEYTQKSDIYSFGIIMSEVFTGYPPYHDIPHDKDLATRICLGYRPKISCKTPQILLDLMNKCLDAEPQNRPTAKELTNKLNHFYKDLKNEETKLCKQIKDIKGSSKEPSMVISTRFTYQTDEQAIYTSRLLHFLELPKPENYRTFQGQSPLSK